MYNGDIGHNDIFTIFTSGFCSAQPKIALPGETYLRKFDPFSFSHYFHRIFCSFQTLLGPRKTQVWFQNYCWGPPHSNSQALDPRTTDEYIIQLNIADL